MRTRVINKTGERIVVEPGEAVDLKGDEERVKIMAARRDVLTVEEVE